MRFNSFEDRVLYMPVGRELDALVAQYIMDWVLVKGARNFIFPSLIPREIFEHYKESLNLRIVKSNNLVDAGSFEKYSEDVRAAFTALERFPYNVEILLKNGEAKEPLYFVTVHGSDGKKVTTYSNDVSHALCRAMVYAKLVWEKDRESNDNSSK